MLLFGEDRALGQWMDSTNMDTTKTDCEKIIDAATSVVIGYEKYLMNKIDYKELAAIITILRETLPEGFDAKYKD